MQAGWNKHSAAPTSDIPAALTEGGAGEPRRGNRGMRDAKRKGKVKCSIALGRLHPGTLFGRKGSSLACPGVNSYSMIKDVEKCGSRKNCKKHCIGFRRGMLLYPLVLTAVRALV